MTAFGRFPPFTIDRLKPQSISAIGDRQKSAKSGLGSINICRLDGRRAYLQISYPSHPAMTWTQEIGAWQLGHVLQPALGLLGNVTLAQPQAGNPQGRTRTLHEWIRTQPAKGLSQ
jgi:hypothetical protein